ncbi:MAG TPA: glycosyltransferase [Candidatus Acidoferrales bacterium]|nr:glycosyltransferase [Candidatus Acidoferrales bacterium]
MSEKLRFRLFAHSWVSDWNHGNAHFLRGLARELVRMGHDVRCYEELGAWSVRNLVLEGKAGAAEIDEFRKTYPELDVRFYQRGESLGPLLDEELRDANVVLLHEWSEPEVVNAVLERKGRFRFKALLHDTHHRAYTNPREILRFRLDQFDGVLAFGEALRRIYQNGFGIARCWTFHEAADADVFCPLAIAKQNDIVWIGNWGDEERTRELMEFLVEPARVLTQRSYRTIVHGVRYPSAALGELKQAGVEYRGYLPNLSTPLVYSASRLALHVPRCQYSNGLSGIPTIRVFEALACGAPLVCAPWTDEEQLFHSGMDYVVVENGDAMLGELEFLLKDDGARAQLSENGRQAVLARHTCRHRAEQLMEICREIRV